MNSIPTASARCLIRWVKNIFKQTRSRPELAQGMKQYMLMTKIIVKLIMTNILLFVLLVFMTTFIGFEMGYASNNSYNNQLIILYFSTAILQVAINYFLFKKKIKSDYRILLVIAVVIVVLYIFYPIVMD
jgi:hypothetical protein